jgi:Xaa-Pro aminopeptidase
MPEERLHLLAQEMQRQGVDAYLATTSISMGYLHGYFENAHERFLVLAVRANGEVRLIAPALSAAQARRVGILDVREWSDGQDPLTHFHDLATDWNLKSAIFAVDDEMPAQLLLKLQLALPAALFREGSPILGELMRRKSPAEVQLLREAGAIADETFDEVLPQIRAGLTEVEVEAMLLAAMRKRGGEPIFCIVAAGSGGAEPHHLNGDRALAEGDVVVLDFGCSWKGYLSDITRTIALGDPGDEARRVYDIVYRAHRAGRAVAKPGVAPEDLDFAARQVIESEGYGPFFYHRLGHGIGMRGHEHPYIVAGNKSRLGVGECFSVEPGIYLEGRFGVRIENIVTITADGHESLNREPSPTLICV